ncbi:carboxymuconolactone decarboxylase family protein [Terasakiella sp. A23]|uniref:carboxymuconolactone decarboxylase family protein n=1 Tax=Terasakiella sp. FCG-A23 TaxID=3080561 RepID=UPI0029532899|nr:carboxymuconolactone decarboxylase family protein [Terasakiella sp. A23]MDV7338263.1 carboxymuconolactone decarboxylase family protein [Terasakiella sp. A23]
MQQRLNHFELSAPLYEKMAAFSMATKEKSSIDKKLLHLIDIRVSQLNGCAFCLDMHVKEAKIAGERELRVHHVAIWAESPLFTDKEKAALAWAEAVTKLGHDGISQDFFNEVREELSEQELSDLTFAVASINSWNRLAIPFTVPPGSADEFFGLNRAGLS